MQLSTNTINKNVPDGGWGWVVVIGVALTNMFNQSLVSVFGLLFSEQLRELGQSTTGVALVMNVNSIVLNFSGFLIGPAIKTFSPRKVSVLGCIFTSTGLILSSQTKYLWQILITYGVFVGFGLGLINPSSFMSVNSYFNKNRGRAVGLALAGTGLGQMLMPHIVRLLLDEYGYRGAILIVGALALHGIVGASLFQPVEWHMGPRSNLNDERRKLLSDNKMEDDDFLEFKESKPKKNIADNNNLNLDEKRESNLKKESFLSKLGTAMDLELLRDMTFINLILGVAMAYTASTNFSMLFPYFLQESVGLNRNDTAFCMSVLAAMDLLSRLTLPTLTDKFKISCRMIFLTGATILIGVRATLAETSNRTHLLIISAIYGYVRAATVVNQNLCISEYSPIDKLAGALGLNMIMKGIAVITLGQLLGWVRDYTNSYKICLHTQNALLVFIVITWSPEIFYKKFLDINRRRNANNPVNLDKT